MKRLNFLGILFMLALPINASTVTTVQLNKNIIEQMQLTQNKEEATKIWQDFIKSKKYKTYVNNYMRNEMNNYTDYELSYVIVDLNADEIPELLVEARMRLGFATTFTFALKNKEVVLVNQMHGYGQFRYSPSRNMIIGVPEFRTFNRTYYSPFYQLKDYKFEHIFDVGMNEGQSIYVDAKQNSKMISDEERMSYYDDEVKFDWIKIQ